MTHRSIERLVAFLALLCASSFIFDSNLSAQESATGDVTASIVAVPDSAGSPCYVNEDGELVCEAPAAVEKVEAEAANPAIDLTTQPWLVESANLPANHPALKREHMIWADSYLWVAVDDIIDGIPVEKWLTQAPTPEDLAGKYVLIEVWATWCPPCRRSLPYLNYIAGKYKDDLVVVSICEMDENAIRNMPGPGLNIFELNYFAAVDTGRRFANKLGVYGIPHAVLLEPTIGGVVWEGMPTLPRYELDDKKLEKFFSIGHKLKDAGRLPEQSPVRFVVSEPTPEDRASRRRVSSKDVDETVGAPSL